ncbi:MAG: hypothetical protein WCV71_00460 [Patescibacteria group bacterium]
MKLKVTSEIIKKYKGKPLIVPVYASRRKLFYTVDDLKSPKNFQYYLGEVNDHEAYISDEGINFIKEIIGFGELACVLYEEKWRPDEYGDIEDIQNWLVWWEKEAKEYIGGSDGNINNMKVDKISRIFKKILLRIYNFITLPLAFFIVLKNLRKRDKEDDD